MNNLQQLLKKLELSSERGVILLSEVFNWINLDKNIFTFEIRERLHKINPSAIYYFNNQPFILFFDKSNPKDKETKKDIQIFKEVWSWDFVPVVFIIYPNEDKIFNAFNYQKRIGQPDTLQEIVPKKGENKYEIFSFLQLQSGSTWKWMEQNFYKKSGRNVLKKQRVNYKLFDNIRYVREKLEQNFPHPEFINILILRLIFIRYLIDREVEIDENFIEGNTIDAKRKCFNELIGDGKKKIITFFNYLKERFNGNLFETETDIDIPSSVLKFLQQFFSDDFSTNSKQASLFYFDVFDFSIIPVEVISGIYESVIDEKKRQEDSAVYTPLFLVDYILNETIEKHLKYKENDLCKVLDPSCGSGIFLTQTYRRLAEREKQLGTLTDERLITIAQQHIFGIDRDTNALNVAAFSIYISILDYKKPKEIKNFRLPKLIGQNLFRNDFFNEDDTIGAIDGVVAHPFNRKLKKEKLDYIIGNPPWGRKNNKKLDKYHLGYAKKMGNLLANYEISQSFLIRAKDFSTKDTACSLIVSSRAFYNSGASKFKSYFFNRFLVNTILDLSAVRRMVFQDAKSPCIVIVYKFAFLQQTAHNKINHLSVKPSSFLKNYKVIIIESNDNKQLLQRYFIDYDWFFKLALYGNALDFLFLKRLENYKQNKTIGDKDIIDNETTIFKGKGILKGKPKKYFPFLEGLNFIESKQIGLYSCYIEHSNTLKKEDTFLESGRKVELFLGEQILLGQRTKQESILNISYSKTNYVFKNSLYAISSRKDITVLKQLYGLLISKFSTYFQFLTSSNWGVSTRPEILLEEYLATPFIEIKNKNFINYINDFIEIYETYYKSILKSPTPPNPENLQSYQCINQIINEAYEISQVEEDLIDYTLNISRYQFQESKLDKFLRKPNKNELEAYANIFYHYFSSVYNEEEEYFQIEIYQLKEFVAMKFIIVSEKPSEQLQIIFSVEKDEKILFEKLAYHLSVYELTSKIFIQKNVKGYEDDFFYIIKPNEYKCWHRAIAHHDLAEFKSEMMQAEMDIITENYG